MKKVILLLVVSFMVNTLPTQAGGLFMSAPADYYWSPSGRLSSYVKPFEEGTDLFSVALNSEEGYVVINDTTAKTEITQVFYNTNEDTIQAYFLFPIPKGEQYDNFEVTVNDEKYRAEKYGVDKTKNIFHDLVRRTKEKKYWEFSETEMYRISIYKMPPNMSYKIKMSYTQPTKTEGIKSYTYPMSFQKIANKGPRDFNLQIKTSSLTEINHVYSLTHDLDLNQSTPNEFSVYLTGKNKKQQKDLTFFYTTDEQNVGYSLYAYKEAEEDGYFMLSFDAGKDKQEVTAKDIIFVLDASDNMSGDKILDARRTLADCMGKLNENDRFNVITFSDEAQSAFKTLQAANSTNIGKAQRYVKDARAVGECNIELALRMAVSAETEKTRPFIIVFVSGGSPTAGLDDEEDLWEILDEVSVKNMQVYPIGLGKKSNTYLLDGISKVTQTHSTYVLPKEDITKKVEALFKEINSPVVGNIQLYFTDNFEVKETYPRAINKVLFNGEPIVLMGRYGEGKKASVSITGTVNGELVRYNYKISFPNEALVHDFVPDLWAARACGTLLEEIQNEGMDEDLIDEILEINEEHQVITPLVTHLVIDDNDYMNTEKEHKVGRIFLAGKNYSNTFRSIQKKSGERIMKVSRDIQGLESVKHPADNHLGQNRMFYKNDEGKLKKNIKNEYKKIQGRNFFKKTDSAWIDAKLATMPKAKPQRVAAYSDEYYKLATTEKGISDFIHFTDEITFELNGKVFEIYDEEKEKARLEAEAEKKAAAEEE